MLKKTRKPEKHLARMLESIAQDPLRPETPRELVDEELRAAGGDPARIRRDGAAFAKALLEQRRKVLEHRDREAEQAAGDGDGEN